MTPSYPISQKKAVISNPEKSFLVPAILSEVSRGILQSLFVNANILD
jgi:hypothetical protein